MTKMCINDGHRYAGPRGNAGPGGIVDVSEAEAKALEEGGYADRVDALPKYAPEPAIERTVERETATSRGAKKREKAVEIDE